jgi:uncharacterized protein (TIGR03437 family)
VHKLESDAAIVNCAMRLLLMILSVSALFAQQPILYHRGTVNAASLAPFGLPNAPIAKGSIFTVFGENLGPASGQSVTAFPLGATFRGVSISVIQSGLTTQAYPIFVSATQVNAVMPSSVSPGLATLRLFYNLAKSNAITIQIASSAPGIFAISSGGYGPGIIQNFISASNQPINSSITPAAPGQTAIIWGTGLGPVTFPDNVAPLAGNVSTPVAVTVGGQTANVLYSGRSPCCSGVDQLVVTLPSNVPLGCWVPVTVNAGGVVSNTTTMAIASAGATACSDTGNPLSALVRTPGTQAFIHVERVDSIENVDPQRPELKTLDNLYSRFYSRPASPYSFDPYMSYPPAGTCIVHQTSGDAFFEKSLRGNLPASASLSSQPAEIYNNGTQQLNIVSNSNAFYSSAVGGTVNSAAIGMNLAGAGASLTVDPAGPNQTVVPINLVPPPVFSRPNAVVVVPRNAPLVVNFTPGDANAPTAIQLYNYAAATNSTVETQCLAAPGATTFTIPADALANFPPSYSMIDGSYADLIVGTLGVDKAVPFTNGLTASGILLNSSWIVQSVVLQ